MPPIRAHCNRRSWLLATAFAVVVTPVASCGGTDKFELTMRTRDAGGYPDYGYCAPANETPQGDQKLGDKCVEQFGERRWVAPDGPRAVSPAHTSTTFTEDFHLRFGDGECGGRLWENRYFLEMRPELGPSEDSFELRLDDGDRLTLDPQTSVVVTDTADTLCGDEAGTWRGTAGDLRNRTGTYVSHYDSIQTVLRLVED